MHQSYAGLTSREAEALQKQFGRNELAESDTSTVLHMFFRQWKNILVVLLAVAGIISLTVGETLDAIFIGIIIVLNTTLGFIQEYKAENAVRSLKKMTVAHVRVLRDGTEKLIQSTDLVPGDIIRLEEGDKIPADGHLLESRHFEVNEASLTGESLPLAKDSRHPETAGVYMGTIVTSGSAVVKITQTGMTTRFGAMAVSLSSIKTDRTPLMKKINRLGMQLSLMAIIITTAVFLLGIAQHRNIIDMLLVSISLAVAAVPEGLPAVITITLAIGLQRMARKNAIMRKLGSIEGLGSTTIIATDKTGTLTQNKMNVIKVWVNNKVFHAEEVRSERTNPTVDLLVTTGILCNNASIIPESKNSTASVIGEHTEGSLLLFAHDIGVSIDDIKKSYELIDEFSFDGQKKRMTMVWKRNGTSHAYVKGAPEQLLAVCTSIMTGKATQKLTASKRAQLLTEFDDFARQGLRILALAYRPLTGKLPSRESVEKNLTFLGFVGIADPARPGLNHILDLTRQAGIRTIMITGDNPLTATSVARHIGLLEPGDRTITGEELSQMTDEQLLPQLGSIRIYARTAPEDKLRIVKLLQQSGEVVSVTGDGVNDALALKQAETGVAMGITGTDVAKEVADMIITDDQYASIVHAIREGRIIFDNIVKSVTYLISCNFGEVLTIFGAFLISAFVSRDIPSPLLPIHILWINLVTDGLPALSLAFDPGSETIMNGRRPNHTNQIITRSTIAFIIPVSIAMACITLSAFFVSLVLFTPAIARAVAFTSLVALQLGIVFFVRDGQRIFSNRILLISVIISFLLQVLIVSAPPLAAIFVR